MTGNIPPSHEKVPTSYASPEQLGGLLANMLDWLEANVPGKKTTDGKPLYGFVIDGNVLSRVVPRMAQVFPDVERIECYSWSGNLNPDDFDGQASCGFSMHKSPKSLYECEDISFFPSGFTGAGELRAEPHRRVTLAESSRLPLPMDSMSVAQRAMDSIFAIRDAYEAGTHEVDLLELGILKEIVDNFSVIQQTQEAGR